MHISVLRPHTVFVVSTQVVSFTSQDKGNTVTVNVYNYCIIKRKGMLNRDVNLGASGVLFFVFISTVSFIPKTFQCSLNATSLLCSDQLEHDYTLYLVCPGLLREVNETSYGIRMGFIGSDIFFTISLFICLYLRCKVYSCLFNFQAPRFLYIGQAFRYSPENAFYIFNQQIYFII